jgi:hypothetical protein
MSKVVGIKGPAQDPDTVLEEAKGEFESVMVIGWDNDGEFAVSASGNLKAMDCLWLVEAYRFNLMNGDYDAD